MSGNASQRRKRSRQRELGRLLVFNPDHFHYQWHKRLQSWISDCRRKSLNAPIYNLLDQALAEFEGVSEFALRILENSNADSEFVCEVMRRIRDVKSDTAEFISAVCNRMVARSIDKKFLLKNYYDILRTKYRWLLSD